MTHRPRKSIFDADRYSESSLNFGGDDSASGQTPVSEKFDPEADNVVRDIGLPSQRNAGRRYGGDVFASMRDEESYGENRD